MADFFYWNKGGSSEGFSHLSVYLKNPSNGRPGWYFANVGTYPPVKIEYTGSVSVSYRIMPVKFGIHHSTAPADEAHKPTKMGNPGDYLVSRSSGGLQIINEHEFSLRFAGKSTSLPGQKVAEASITIETGATGTLPTSSPPSMGGGSSGGY